MIRALEAVKTEDVLFIDIETAAVEPHLVADTPLQQAWAYKARYNNEMNKKTGLEYTEEEYYLEKAALYAPFARVIVITIGKIVEKDGEPTKIVLKSFSGDDEKALLTEFNNALGGYLVKSPKLTLCGLNNIGFDEPMLFKRMLVHQIKPHVLIDSSGLKPWEVKSIDLGKMFQGSSFYPDSLVAICMALGIPSSKDGIDGSMTTEAYYKGRLEEITKYCERDVVATANVFLRMRFKNLIEEVTVVAQKEAETIAPLLQRLYVSKTLSEDLKQEIRDKKILKKDLPIVKKLVSAHFLEKIDIMAMNKKDLKEINEARTDELNEFFESLK